MTLRARKLVAGLAALLVLVVLLTVVFPRAGDPKLWPPKSGNALTDIYVVSHGYHAGIVIDRSAMARAVSENGHRSLIAISQRFASHRWLEIGWGDQGFYTLVPDTASITAGLALRALFMPGNPSVLHVVGLTNDPRTAFPNSDMVRIELSDAGFARMLDRLEASFARNLDNAPDDLGPGLYGASRFFRGVEHFNIFRVCNHWVARLLSAAGVPVSQAASTLPQGLFLDLRWRSGLEPLPKSSG
jgi:uncharacterized protein (TIGR02117 family)